MRVIARLWFLAKSLKNTAIAAAEINSTHEQNSISVTIDQKWIFRFHDRNIETKHVPKIGTLCRLGLESLQQLLKTVIFSIDMIVTSLNLSSS